VAQKSNLITIRKRKNNLNISVFNTKAWAFVFKDIQFFSRLFFLKNVWIVKYLVTVDTNLIFLELFLFYQTKIIVFYKKNKKKIKKKRRKKRKLSIFYPASKDFLKLNFSNSQKEKKNLKNYLVKLRPLNVFVVKKELKRLYFKLKSFSGSLFSRRYFFFLDFLKMTNLFSNGFIDVSFYILVLNRIFKRLPKRTHNKFFVFIDLLFTCLLEKKKMQRRMNVKERKFCIGGIKLLVTGRIQGEERSSIKRIQVGSVPTQSFKKKIDFSASHVYTLYGAFGFKLWVNKLYYKNSYAIYSDKIQTQKVTKRKVFQQNKR
jgi:hypothetical protein